MKRIYAAANLQEAHLIVDLLRHDGIEAWVLNENAQGGLGEIPFTQAYPDIWVRDDQDAQRALAIISRFEQTPIAAGSTRCGRCGESNPSTFDLCWNCREPLG